MSGVHRMGEPCPTCGGALTIIPDGSKQPPFCMACRKKLVEGIGQAFREGVISEEAVRGLSGEEEGTGGKLNIYTCQTCRGHLVTRDVDRGVTPFMIGCKAIPGCGGHMQSSMYRVFDQTMAETHQWYRPPAVQVLTPAEQQHVRQGGLLLRPAVKASPS